MRKGQVIINEEESSFGISLLCLITLKTANVEDVLPHYSLNHCIIVFAFALYSTTCDCGCMFQIKTELFQINIV